MAENGHLQKIHLLVRDRIFLSISSSFFFFVIFYTLLDLYYKCHLFLDKSPCKLYFVIVIRLQLLTIQKYLNFYFKLCAYACHGETYICIGALFRSKVSDAQSWCSWWLWATKYACWEMNSGLLKAQYLSLLLCHLSNPLIL